MRLGFTFLLAILINGVVVASAAAEDQQSDPVASEPEKNYVLPAVEILGFQALLNIFNRSFAHDHEDYETDFNTISDNLEGGWEFDRDSFDINQIGHPYQGAIYFGLSRSNGLNFWESLGYTTVGSYVWEIAGETTKPSVNDQITTTFGGGFLGEAMFRTAQTFYKTADRTGKSGPEVGGTVVDPASGVNRALGQESTPDLDRTRPAYIRELEIGYAHHVNVFNAFDSDSVTKDIAVARFFIDYGLPGKPGYDYEKPFDYFNLDAALTTSSNDNVDHILVNGLLYGKEYEGGKDYRGIFGLYANYNYLAPEIYRVGSSGVSLGSNGQWWLSKSIALQGSLMAGVGFGSGGTIHATEGGNDYHYGAVPQALGNLRFIMKEVGMLDLSGQDYIVSGPSSDPSGTSDENISRLKAAVTFLVSGPHAVGVSYTASRRNAPFKSSPDQHQRLETVGVDYTYLWGGDLGAVEWR